MKSCCLGKVDCTRSGIIAGSGRSTFLLGFRPKIVKMWITRVWNPLSEFPDLLQVLQEKVRQNVIWGYWEWLTVAVNHSHFIHGGSLPRHPLRRLRLRNMTHRRWRCICDIRPTRNPAPMVPHSSTPRGSRCPQGQPGEDPLACPRLQFQCAVRPFSCKRGKEIGKIGLKSCRVYTCTAPRSRFLVNAENR